MQVGGSKSVAGSENTRTSFIDTKIFNQKRSHDQMTEQGGVVSDSIGTLSKKIKMACQTIYGFEYMISSEDDWIKFYSSNVSNIMENLKEEVKMLEFHKIYKDEIMLSTQRKYTSLLEYERELMDSASVNEDKMGSSSRSVISSRLNDINRMKQQMSNIYPHVHQIVDAARSADTTVSSIPSSSEKHLLDHSDKQLQPDSDIDPPTSFIQVGGGGAIMNNNTAGAPLASQTNQTSDVSHDSQSVIGQASNTFDYLSDDDFSLSGFPFDEMSNDGHTTSIVSQNNEHHQDMVGMMGGYVNGLSDQYNKH